MRIDVVATDEEFARRAADIVCAAVRGQPAAAIGLPSGNTPLGLYAELARRVREGNADFSRVTIFAIDELHGIRRDHPATNARYFREHLTQHLPLRAFHLLNSEAGEPESECDRFRRLIEGAGGLDLVVLGIGLSGHIGFNEPGSSFDSRARRVALARTTLEAYAHLFRSVEAPAFGLTLGLADLLAARRVLLLGKSLDKAAVVANALEGPVSEALPASALQRHPELTVVLDREAASRLSKRHEPAS
jgi:glucosamine-6-phosphate deaminase